METKFRAWDKENKYFVDPVFYFIGLDGSAWFNLGGATEDKDNLIDQSEKLEIMQYTGLKDKNGKEIYEGDIVKWFVNDVVSTAPVGFEDGAFWMLKDIETSFSVYNDWLRGEYEIIGNIYENPELLAVDKAGTK